MNQLDKFELKDLKAMAYDEYQKLAFIQNNIRILEDEIKNRLNDQKDEQ